MRERLRPLLNSRSMELLRLPHLKGLAASMPPLSSLNRCIASLEVVKFLALSHPEQVPPLLQTLCKKYKFATNQTCDLRYSSTVLGPYLTQIFARLSVSTDDMQLVC